MPYVDFKAIKAAVSIEDAANLLKLPVKKSGNQLRSNCPACGNRLAGFFTVSMQKSAEIVWHSSST